MPINLLYTACVQNLLKLWWDIIPRALFNAGWTDSLWLCESPSMLLLMPPPPFDPAYLPLLTLGTCRCLQ